MVKVGGDKLPPGKPSGVPDETGGVSGGKGGAKPEKKEGPIRKLVRRIFKGGGQRGAEATAGLGDRQVTTGKEEKGVLDAAFRGQPSPREMKAKMLKALVDKFNKEMKPEDRAGNTAIEITRHPYTMVTILSKIDLTIEDRSKLVTTLLIDQLRSKLSTYSGDKKVKLAQNLGELSKSDTIDGKAQLAITAFLAEIVEDIERSSQGGLG